MFFLAFAILEKTKVLGENKQINALVSFVISFIFVSVAYPTQVASNLILFLTIAIVVIFVALLLWGFVSGSSKVEISSTPLKWVIGIVVIIAVIAATIWATGAQNPLIDFFFKQSWSKNFWTNFAFIVVIAIALALVLTGKKD
jgi:hypothetical protein